jgi:hypothetical protein
VGVLAVGGDLHVTCRVDKHDGPLDEQENAGEDRQENWWKTVTYTCKACGISWTRTTGPGSR